MSDYVNVKINEYDLLDMLMNRVKVWNDDTDVQKLYEIMYEKYIECGIFDGMKLDVGQIVDNDYINYCTVLSDGDEGYNVVDKLYKDGGCCDISCDNDYGYSFIESYYCGMYLVRL